MTWHFLLLQNDERDQHAGFPVVPLATKRAHLCEYDKAGCRDFLKYPDSA